jgi:hypothetical protein
MGDVNQKFLAVHQGWRLRTTKGWVDRWRMAMSNFGVKFGSSGDLPDFFSLGGSGL